MRIAGKCHCGNISYTMEFDGALADIPVRACTCSFCVKHGGAWTSHPGARLDVTVRDPARHARYEFATKTAEFHICTGCGVVPLVTCRLDDRTLAVVNVNTFDDIDLSTLKKAPMSFEGEQIEQRLARRQRNWISDVRFAGGNG